jgi:DNA-directed RNA polymerase specialized sigma24 family protein
VALIEGCSVGTVKSRVFRGKNLLRVALGQENES